MGVHIKQVEFRENVRMFLSPGTRQTVHNNYRGVCIKRVSIKLAVTVKVAFLRARVIMLDRIIRNS